jgi:hypothetical protein
VKSQNGLSGSAANFLALPLQQANIKHGSHRRKNSGARAAIAKKQQEAQSASGELELAIPICVSWAPKWTKDPDPRKNPPQMPSWIKPVSGRPLVSKAGIWATHMTANGLILWSELPGLANKITVHLARPEPIAALENLHS